jgi:hypothetical protein
MAAPVQAAGKLENIPMHGIATRDIQNPAHQHGYYTHGLAGSAISVTSYVIASRGKMADAMGFSVV